MVLEIHRVEERITEVSSKFKLHPRGESPVKLPDNFRTIGWRELEADQRLLDGLIECYQEVYGSDELGIDGKILWGEGGMCREEGWVQVIPLKQFREIQAQGEALCANCRAGLVECYPKDELVPRICRELTTGVNPFLTLMTGNGESVAGFAWGAALTTEQIAQRVIEYRYAKKPDQGRQAVEPLLSTLAEMGVERMVYYDELAIHPESRRGFDPVRFLPRDGFEMGVDEGIYQTGFWTKPASKIYPITYAFGFKPVAQVGELTFMLNTDVRPTLKMLQNLPEGVLAQHIAFVLRGN